MWLRSPAWDSFWMLAGAWFLALAAFGGPLKSGAAYVLTAAFWIAHRLASTYIAFCRPEYRELLRGQPERFVRAPAALAAAVFAFLLAPAWLVPLDPFARVLLLAGLDLAWEFWHFTTQHYGIASLYRLRAGQDPRGDGKEREKAFCLGVGGLALLAAAVFHAGRALRPEWPWAWLRWSGSAAVAAALAGACRAEFQHERPSLPKALYFASVALPPLAAFHMRSFAPMFIVVPVQHWLAALGLTLHMAGPAGKAEGWYRLWAWFDRPWRLLLLLVPLSAALAPTMRLASVEKQALLEALSSLSLALSGPHPSAALRVLLGLGFATSFLHYWMDRSVFRLSDPEVRARTLPLALRAP